MTTLETALNESPFYLGIDYGHLGTSDCCGNKLYLSYHETRGWSVARYNIFWQIVRFIFQCFAETHLKLVVERLSQEGSLPRHLKDRIQILWANAYPNETCPPLETNQVLRADARITDAAPFNKDSVHDLSRYLSDDDALRPEDGTTPIENDFYLQVEMKSHLNPTERSLQYFRASLLKEKQKTMSFVSEEMESFLS